MADGRLNHLGPDFPTLIRHNSATSPDIVLSNRYLNTRITRGNLTTSNHIPIILDLSTNPILIAATPRPDYKNAKWERYKEFLEEKPMQNLEGKPTTDIDQETDRWFQDIRDAK